MTRKFLQISMIVVITLVMALTATAVFAQEPVDVDREELEGVAEHFELPEGVADISALAQQIITVSQILPIQGQLTDKAGTPINGARIVTFTLYMRDKDGEGKWLPRCTDSKEVQVNEGFFSSEIEGCDVKDISGFEVYLGITVEGDTEMTPRQPLLPVPYAYSLIPGANIQGNRNGKEVLFVVNFASDTNSIGVLSQMEALGGRTYALYGFNKSSGGRGVYGIATSSTGATYGVYGLSQSDQGIGVRGWAEASTGKTVGVFGRSSSNEGIGVQGLADALLGTTYGVHGQSDSESGAGVYGYASLTNATQDTYGVYGRSDGPLGYGVYGTGLYTGTTGFATNPTGPTYGLYGQSDSDNGYGVYGHTTAMSGTTYGLYGKSDTITGTAYGVYGKSDSDNGYGVYGHTAIVSGTTYGVYGKSDSNNGYGVYGYTTAMTGTADGVYGKSEANQGAGVRGSHASNGVGVIAQSESGNPIEAYGSVATDTIFRVSNDGSVYSGGSYHCGGTITETVTTISETVVITSVARTELGPCLQDQGEADFAEMLPMNNDVLEPGDVLIINLDGELAKSDTAYQSTVVGVYSTKPSYLGNSQRWGEDGYAPLALVGIVQVKVSTENGAIQPGDLLVASDTPGHAMRAGVDSPNGTVIGKALMGLNDGKGMIRMLVMLQ